MPQRTYSVNLGESVPPRLCYGSSFETHLLHC